jgi:hypothetical protein
MLYFRIRDRKLQLNREKAIPQSQYLTAYPYVGSIMPRRSTVLEIGLEILSPDHEAVTMVNERFEDTIEIEILGGTSHFVVVKARVFDDNELKRRMEERGFMD